MRSGNNNKKIWILLAIEVIIIAALVVLIIILFNNKAEEETRTTVESEEINHYYDPITQEEYYDINQESELDEDGNEVAAMRAVGFGDLFEAIGQETYTQFFDGTQEYFQKNYPKMKFVSLDSKTLSCNENICTFTIYMNGKKPIDVLLTISPYLAEYRARE